MDELLPNLSAEAYSAADEAVQKWYRKLEDGSYRLKVKEDSGWALENVSSLRNALEDEKDKRRKATSRVEGLPDDFNGETFRKLKADSDRLKDVLDKHGKDDEKTQAKIKASVEEATAPLLTQIDELKKQNGGLSGEVGELLVDAEVRRLMSTEAYGLQGEADLVIDRVRRETRVVKGDDGKHAVQVVRPGTEVVRQHTKDGKVGDMQLKDLLASLRDDPIMGRAFDGEGIAGSGTPGSPRRGGPQGGKNPFKKETVNLSEQSRLRKENPAEYRRLRAEAGLPPLQGEQAGAAPV